jgi:predicted enzyme related to lactoylglutathione lyase
VSDRARLVGINHVALEVGDVDEALELYGRLFRFSLRGRAGRMAFLDMGDQFLALAEGSGGSGGGHFGLVVDDLDAVREAVAREGLVAGDPAVRGFGFRDPWGNLIEVVAYSEVQFERTPGVKRALGIEALAKGDSARGEIDSKGLG